MNRYAYSGRNCYGRDVPRYLHIDQIKEKPSKTVFECRIYDKNGKLKRVVTEKEIIRKGIEKSVKKK